MGCVGLCMKMRAIPGSPANKYILIFSISLNTYKYITGIQQFNYY